MVDCPTKQNATNTVNEANGDTMKITSRQLRQEVRKLVQEQVEQTDSAEARRKAWRNANRRRQYQWQKEQGTLPKRSRTPRGPFTGQLTAWIGGQKASFQELPKNVQRVVQLFDSLDPGREVGHLSVRERHGEWSINLWGERYVNVRTRGHARAGAVSAGGDWRNVDFDPDVDSQEKLTVGVHASIDASGNIDVVGSRSLGWHVDDHVDLSHGKSLKVSAIKDWAATNFGFSGSGGARSWQEDEFDAAPRSGNSVVRPAP